MSKLDPEVLYLILTKVAAKETLYNYDPHKLPQGQAPGTITTRHLSEVYERITNNRIGARLNWNVPLDELDLLLKKCGLPSLQAVVIPEKDQDNPSSSVELLGKAHATKWPHFSALKNFYRKNK